MMGSRPKMPKESRQDVIDDINRLQLPPDELITILLAHFTTLDLILIRDLHTPDKEPK